MTLNFELLQHYLHGNSLISMTNVSTRRKIVTICDYEQYRSIIICSKINNINIDPELLKSIINIKIYLIKAKTG
ncbi:hypothetical protein Glove_109g231 [Diversispora epigaea]|uniref:Uncharacterized protein n=1 Tax=Diversispora epigaea TaxID=1348612 RepID=A0A397J8Q0_9GLOM|nr:hypothetical protein Glove_109g231 [Diversispora epigaea]